MRLGRARKFKPLINTTKIVSAPVGGSLIKTLNGLAIASVKTRNGLAIASIKTINGLTNV